MRVKLLSSKLIIEFYQRKFTTAIYIYIYIYGFKFQSTLGKNLSGDI